MTTLNLDPPKPEDALVRLRNNQGADCLNIGTSEFKPDHRKAFWVPKKDVTRELLTVGGFYPEPISLRDALQDVATAVVAMPAGPHKDALKAALAALCEPVDEPEA